MNQSLKAVVCATTLVTLAAAAAFPGVRENLLFMDIPTVVTATLTAKNSDKAPASMTVITRKEIQMSGAKDLPELLNQVNGISVYKAMYGRQIVSLRGITNLFNSKYKLLIDGHAFNEPMWNTFDFYAIPLENIKQVEIVRGPGSSLYGTGAFAGVINVILRTPEEINGLEVDVRYGSYNARWGSIAYGTVRENWKLGISAAHYTTDGSVPVIETDRFSGLPFSQAPGKGRDDKFRNAFGLTYQYQNLEVEANLSHFNDHLPLTEMGTFLRDGEAKDFFAGYLEARHTLTISEALKLKTKVSYDNTDIVVSGKVFPDGTMLAADPSMMWPNGARAEYGYRADQYHAEAVADYTPFTGNELLLGVFYESIKTKDVFLKMQTHPVYLYNPGYMQDFTDTVNWNKPASRIVTGAFFQDEWTLTKELYLILGGRFDQYDDVGTSLTPRAGLIWEYRPNNNVKLLYGSAFRAPSFAELYHQNNPVLIGNPRLKPETLDSVELNFNNIFADRIHSSLAIYSLRTDNLIDYSLEPIPASP